MTGITILDVVISLVFIFFIISLLVSQIVEIINTILRRRENFLLEAITRIFGEDFKDVKQYFKELDDKKSNNQGSGNQTSVKQGSGSQASTEQDAASQGTDSQASAKTKSSETITSMIYQNPLVKSLVKRNKDLPKNIEGELFARVIIQELGGEKALSKKGKEFEDWLNKAIKRADENFENKALYKLLDSLSEGVDEINKYIANIENWYNGHMEDVRAWFKANTRWYLATVGLILAFAFNIDTIHMVERLWKDSALRDEFVQQAISTTETKGAELSNDVSADSSGTVERENLNEHLVEEFVNLPIGWKNCDWGFCDTSGSVTSIENGGDENTIIKYVWHILGWLITAIAVSFGAPFWYQAMNNLVALRNTVAPKKTTNESS